MTESDSANTLSQTAEQASISLPPSLFELYSNDAFTLLFTMMNSSVLLPYSATTNPSIRVASSVIGATLLDHDVRDLDDNITIILRLEYPVSIAILEPVIHIVVIHCDTVCGQQKNNIFCIYRSLILLLVLCGNKQRQVRKKIVSCSSHSLECRLS